MYICVCIYNYSCILLSAFGPLSYGRRCSSARIAMHSSPSHRTLSPPTSSQSNRPTCYPPSTQYMHTTLYIYVHISVSRALVCGRRSSRVKLIMRHNLVTSGPFYCRHCRSETGLQAIRFRRNRCLYVRYLYVYMYMYIHIHVYI